MRKCTKLSYIKEKYGTDEEALNQLKKGVEACENGIKQIQSVLDINTAMNTKYLKDYSEWEKERKEYDTKMTEKKVECLSIANAYKWTGCVSPCFGTDTGCKTNKCNDELSSVYSGIYEYAGDTDSCGTLSTGRKYRCRYKNSSTVYENCMNARFYNTFKYIPIKPDTPEYLPLPDFKCQICPNIVSINAETSDISGKILQYNQCIMETKEMISELEQEKKTYDNSPIIVKILTIILNNSNSIRPIILIATIIIVAILLIGMKH